MFYDIACVVLQGSRLTDSVRTQICITASELMKRGAKKIKTKTDDFEGFVSTQGKTGVLGSIAGIVFVADGESDEGRIRVEFIMRFPVSQKSFDDGETFWMTGGIGPQNAYLN